MKHDETKMTMQTILKPVATALAKRGFRQRNDGAWVQQNISVAFRPQDNSFVGRWTDGQLHEYMFFDFPADDLEKCHFEFALLMHWVGERQKLRQASDALAA